MSSEVITPAVRVSLRSRLTGSLVLPAALAVVCITLGGATQSSGFLLGITWRNILITASFSSIVCCGVGTLLIGGGFDLSVGAVYLAGTMLSADLVSHGVPVIIALLAAVAVGAGVGLINGLLVNFVEVSAIMVTLGGMFAVTAIVTSLSGGLSVGPITGDFANLGQGSFLSINYVIWMALGVAVILHVLLEYTPTGTKIRGLGGNRAAMENLSINVRGLSTALYTMCGALAAFAGVLQAANLGAGTPTVGSSLELTAVAAAVIGGVSIWGAVGSISGMVVGSVLLSLITVAISLLHWSGDMANFATGMILVLAVIVDRVRRSQMFQVGKGATITERSADAAAPSDTVMSGAEA